MNRHRFVWNSQHSITSVTSRVSGYDAVLNSTAGHILYTISANKSHFDLVRDKYPAFIEMCIKYGWLTTKGSINGQITHVDQEYPLKRLQIELTRQCNLRCSYCYSLSGPMEKVRLHIDDVARLLDDAAQLGCIWIDFTGGEFFLYRWWREALALAQQHGFVITLHSNGTLISKEILLYLSHVGIRHIQISADSHLDKIHDAIRGKEGALHKTLRGIRDIQAAGINVRVALMAHRENTDSYIDTVTWFMEVLGVPVTCDRIVAAGGERTAGVGLSTKEYFELVAPLTGRKIGSTRICDNPGESMEHVEPHCGVAQSFVYITAEGEYALCPTMTSRDNALFQGPTLSQMSLSEAWVNSTHFNKYRNLNCKNTGHCPKASRCGGGCRSNAYIETGALDAPDLLSCNIQKNPDAEYVDFLPRYAAGIYGHAAKNEE